MDAYIDSTSHLITAKTQRNNCIRPEHMEYDTGLRSNEASGGQSQAPYIPTELALEHHPLSIHSKRQSSICTAHYLNVSLRMCESKHRTSSAVLCDTTVSSF